MSVDDLVTSVKLPAISVHKAVYDKEITHFVGKRYATCGHMSFDDYLQLIRDLEEEDMRLAPITTIAVGRDSSGELLATARAISRTDADSTLLPIETFLGHRFLLPESSRLFEISRLASVAAASFGLMQGMLAALCQHCSPDPERDVVVACLDHSLYQRISDIGWPIRPIGDPVFYMGSETVPIRVDIRSFLSLVNMV